MYTYPREGWLLYPPRQIPEQDVIVEPVREPVTLEELKTHLRIDLPDLDSYLTNLIRGARQWVEKYTGLALVSQTLEMYLDSYPAGGMITLRGPLIDVVSFDYLDGTYQAIAADQYVIDTRAKAPRLTPASGVSWSFSGTPNYLRVRWRAGFVDTSASPTQDDSLVPENLRTAIMFHAEAIHTRDERMMDKILEVAANLCKPYVVDFGFA